MTDQAERFATAIADRYQLERVLGEGGMATVYLAHDVKHNRKVAVKMMHPELMTAVGSERFIREIETTANLRHPHILPLYDSGEAGGLLFYVMPYVEGETLRDRIDREKQLHIDDAVRIACEVADALSFAHARGVVHRDIKPENILLESNHAVVADFGIAKAVNAGGTQLTATGVAVGTPAYMSPEQAAGESDLEGTSDVYSLGCVFYEMLAGQPPFVGPTTEILVRQHIAVDPTPVNTLRPGVPPTIAHALTRSLAKTPADRFDPTDGFGKALRHGSATSGDAVSPKPRANATALVTAAVAVIAIVAASFFGFSAIRSDDSSSSASNMPRVAVLPFENSGAPDEAFFADGITEEITARLASVPNLSVIARASANQYKGSEKSMVEIADELGVDYLLLGSVRWQRATADEHQVRVTPQLIRVSDETQLWAEVYGGDASRVFEVQSDIAQQVRAALNVTLGAEEQTATPLAPPTEDMEAYALYLRGNGEMERAAADVSNLDFRDAVSFYEQATTIDPNFALGWARLANANIFAHWFRNPGEDYLPNAREAVERAFEIDSTLPQAHAARGFLLYYGSRDYDGALVEFNTARESLPNDAELLVNAGLIYRRLGNWDEARSLMQRAAALDPRSPLTLTQTALTHMSLREYDEARLYLERAIAINPANMGAYFLIASTHLMEGNLTSANEVVDRGLTTNNLTVPETLAYNIDPDAWIFAPHMFLTGLIDADALEYEPLTSAHMPAYHLFKGQLYEFLGRTAQSRSHYDSAVVASRGELTSMSENANVHARMAMALAGTGRREEAMRAGEQAVELLPQTTDALGGGRLTWILGLVYAKVGEYDKAMDQFEAALAAPNEFTRSWMRLHPGLEPLRELPRFIATVEQP